MSDAAAPTEDERAVVLCGFMGVGKSSIGRRVASALGRRFVDSDVVVAARLGRSIPEVFLAGEEALFRRTEAEVIAETVRCRPPVVLAIGGGALGEEETRDVLLRESLLVHLDQPFEELAAALPSLRRGRPLLSGRDVGEMRALYDSRRELYALAPLQLVVHRDGVGAAAEQVLRALAEAPQVP